MSKRIIYTGPPGFNARLGRPVKTGEDITGGDPRTLADMVSMGVASIEEIEKTKPRAKTEGE